MIRKLSKYTDLVIAVIIVIGAAIILVNAGRGTEPVMPQHTIVDADPAQGVIEIQQYGCGSCHAIPGVSGSTRQVGPSLEHFGSRSYIAGQFANVPENLVPWIENAQAMIPGNAMPNLNVSDQAARNMAAYLYTLR